MPVHNAEIAGLFSRLADLLELEDANPFRVRAYRTAARNINGLSHSLLNKRPPLDVDMEKLMQAARERGCFPELNAQPARLDLTDSDCMLARELQLKVVISTDAHSTGNLDYMRFGVSQARHGWLGPGDVINTRGLDELRKLLRRN